MVPLVGQQPQTQTGTRTRTLPASITKDSTSRFIPPPFGHFGLPEVAEPTTDRGTWTRASRARRKRPSSIVRRKAASALGKRKATFPLTPSPSPPLRGRGEQIGRRSPYCVRRLLLLLLRRRQRQHELGVLVAHVRP